MATIATLCASGDIEPYELPATQPGNPERRLYLAVDALQWLDGPCTEAAPSGWTEREDEPTYPIEQIEQRLNDFVEGEPMRAGDLKLMEPVAFGVWAFKTRDVRLLGCFVDDNCFVAVAGDLRGNLTKGKYRALVRAVKTKIRELGLTPKMGDLHGLTRLS